MPNQREQVRRYTTSGKSGDKDSSQADNGKAGTVDLRGQKCEKCGHPLIAATLGKKGLGCKACGVLASSSL